MKKIAYLLVFSVLLLFLPSITNAASCLERFQQQWHGCNSDYNSCDKVIEVDIGITILTIRDEFSCHSERESCRSWVEDKYLDCND